MRLMWLLAISCAAAAQSEWPQFGGPNRNFMVDDPGLTGDWPAAGPKVLWQRALGDGYSGTSVSGGVAFTMFKRGVDDITTAIDTKTGKTLWEYAASRNTDRRLDLQFGSGPHSTPLIVDGRLFTVNTVGKLLALDVKTGKLLWTHDLWGELHGSNLDRGYSASPIAWKDTIILPVGGKQQALVAFRQKDGSIAWRREDYDCTFSSPFFIDLNGLTQLVLFYGRQVVGFNADNGDPQWSVTHRTEYNLNIALPVYGPDGILVMSSAYDGGSRGIQLTRDGQQTRVKELWDHKRLRVHHGNMLRLGDYVYGSSGDFGPAPLTCVNVKDGKVVWQDRALGKSSLLQAGSKTILLSEDGDLALATLSPEGLKIISRASLLRSNAWTAPSLAGGILYVRDRSSIAAVSLR